MESLSRALGLVDGRDHTPISRNGRCNCRDGRTASRGQSQGGVTAPDGRRRGTGLVCHNAGDSRGGERGRGKPRPPGSAGEDGPGPGRAPSPDRPPATAQGGQPDRMLRLLHTADVHLGARHTDLGEQAAAQRERQFAAFKAAIDLALAEKVDIVLIAGDLFDSNTQPRRSVERVAAELKRLGAARIRAVVITRDPRRLRPFVALPGPRPRRPGRLGPTADDDFVTLLTPDRPSVHLAACDVIVHGAGLPTKRAPHSPLRDLRVQRRRRRDVARRDGPWLARDPGPDRSRRGRLHPRGDRGDAVSTISPSATGTPSSRAGPA